MNRSLAITLKWMTIFVLSIIISGCAEDPTQNWKPSKILIGEQVLSIEDFYKK